MDSVGDWATSDVACSAWEGEMAAEILKGSEKLGRREAFLVGRVVQ